MDIDGFGWLLKYKLPGIMVAHIIKGPPNRFAEALLGYGNSNSQRVIDRGEGYILPDHFNYDSSSTLLDTYSDGAYIFLTKMDKILYSTIWRNIGRFHEEDFRLLYSDVAINKLYSNGESEIWKI